MVVDNTLATPLLMRPLELGADVTIHSATKLLGGHSDVMGGVAAGRFEAMASIRQSNRVWGSTLDPFAAWLIVRGIRTLPLRVARTCENAMRAAEFLSGQPAVSAVHYPGLDSHPQHELAKSTLEGGFGSMVSFELRGGVEAASKFIRSLKMIRFAASLGETCTTVSHPAKTSHRSLTEGEREEVGIYGGLIRMSCGIESAEDIEDGPGAGVGEPVSGAGDGAAQIRDILVLSSALHLGPRSASVFSAATATARGIRSGATRLYYRRNPGEIN